MYYRNIRYIIYTALYPKHSMGLQYMPTLGWCQRGQLMRIYGSPMGRVWVYIYNWGYVVQPGLPSPAYIP